MQVEVKLGLHTGEAAHIDDAAADGGRFHRLHDDWTRQHVDHEIDAVAGGGREHRISPGRIAGVNGEIGAKLLETRAARVVGGRADHQFGAHQFGDLQAHEADA